VWHVACVHWSSSWSGVGQHSARQQGSCSRQQQVPDIHTNVMSRSASTWQNATCYGPHFMLNCVAKSFPNISVCFMYISCSLTISSWLLGHPEREVAYVLLLMLFIFSQCKISELCLPIDVKLCHVMGSMFNFVIQVPKFGGALPHKIWGQEGAKFAVI